MKLIFLWQFLGDIPHQLDSNKTLIDSVGINAIGTKAPNQKKKKKLNIKKQLQCVFLWVLLFLRYLLKITLLIS